jgi:anti-sigma regulatory factor (Ser/Thr protein kinase)
MKRLNSCEATWPAVPASVPRARAFVTDYLMQRVPAEVVIGARLIASELATNAVLHAGTPFTVTVEYAGTDVTIRVRDGSSQVPDASSPERLADRGRGLVLVDALSDSWGVSVETGGGKSVWARCATAPSG